MEIVRLELADFRNYGRQTVEPIGGINVFFGLNAQGKTNLLEAISLCCIGRSPRTPRDKELIRWECDKAKVEVDVKTNFGEENVRIILSQRENKRIAVNGLPITKIGELMGVVKSSYFSPNEIKIVKSSPQERRSFMDVALCQLSKTYFYLLQRYNKILAQRNKLLKTSNTGSEVLSVWNAQLSEEGAKIVKTRKGFLKNLSVHAKENHAFLTSQKEEIEISYDGLEGETHEEIKAAFNGELKRTKDKDLFLGYTHTGPHKDDINILANGIDLRAYGSQGQLRTAALTLKLSELDIMTTLTNDRPILLLDDVLSELDEKRQEGLMERIKNTQVFITCTDLNFHAFKNIKGYKAFQIENGKIL